ncbi:MAG: SMI1/KNR4 family protein [Planctomycetota bacterium]
MKSQAWTDILKVLERWSPLGETKASTGARLIGHVPHVAPLAYFHLVYLPLGTPEIEQLEKLAQRPIPRAYSEFLSISNGANLFNDKLRLNGLRMSYNRDPDASCLPYALETANTHERPTGSPDDVVFFGGYSFDGSRLWMRPGDPKVYRCPRREFLPTLNTWPSFEAMLEAEVNRLALRFDERGVLIDPNTPTTPPVDGVPPPGH